MKNKIALFVLVALFAAAAVLAHTGWEPDNITFAVPAAASVNTGSCGSPSCSSVDGVCSNSRGEVTGTCSAGQTLVVVFGTMLSPSAPICTCSAANAAADVVTSGAMRCRATQTALTITATTAITAGAIGYTCLR